MFNEAEKVLDQLRWSTRKGNNWSWWGALPVDRFIALEWGTKKAVKTVYLSNCIVYWAIKKWNVALLQHTLWLSSLRVQSILSNELQKYNFVIDLDLNELLANQGNNMSAS